MRVYLSASELLLCHAAAAGLQHAGVDHFHPGAGLAAAGAQGLDRLDDVEALLIVHPAKDDMLVVQPLGLDSGDEELGSVGVGAGVGHGEQPGGAVLHQEVLIIELGTIDALSPRTIKILKISTLDHELGNDAMEDGAPVGEPLLVLAAGDAVEVPGSQRHNLVKKLHDNSSTGLIIDCDIKENL